ncbi:MAG: two-component sensor histidine kinase [Gammaproteobacteria bacterium]|nr:two-component sensor histidine kinase [Gammaproteobacteria bacterium]
MRSLTASLLIVTLVTILALGWALDRLFLRYAGEPDSTDTLATYREIGQQLASVVDAQVIPGEFLEQWPDNSTVLLDLLDEDSFPVPENLLSGFRDGDPLVLESDSDVSIYYHLPSHGKILGLTPLNVSPAQHTPLRLILTMVFYIGVGILLLAWLYPLIRRLLALRYSAIEFGKGHLDSRVSTRGLSYITDIETEFNRMADRIQTLVTDNRLLSSAVSHDLRTPLARLRFGIDTLSETPADAAQQAYIERLSNDIDAMEKLVNSLLSFARLDHVMASAESKPTDLAGLVRECVNLYADEPIDVLSEHIEQVSVAGNTDFLGMLTNNLLQNAATHAKSTVQVRLVSQNNIANLIVEDDGPGIPDAQRETVMMPFQRGIQNKETNGVDTNSKNKKSGHGLGLAIVARLAQWHGASVKVTDSERLGGAQITVGFPLV